MEVVLFQPRIVLVGMSLQHSMGRGRRTANYATGTATNPTSIKNLYKYGGTVWVIIYLIMGLGEVGTVAGAAGVVLDAYVMKLFGWPWDEILLANTFLGLIVSHVQTWVAGWLVATAKYGLNS